MTILDIMAIPNNVYNTDCKPLEEVKIRTLVDGQYKDIPALDKHWIASGKIFVQYFSPPFANIDGTYPMGAREDWLERITYFHEDLKWLLNLEHHRFWSQLSFGEDCLTGIESFLQEATPFYVIKSFPDDPKMLQEYKITQHLVFLVICRIICEKESKEEWIGKKKLSQLWYDKYIMTLPMMLDMCLLYGDSNTLHLTKLIKTVFSIQPMYTEDVKNAVCFIDERLRMVQEKMRSRKVNGQNYPVKLVDRNSSSRSELTLLSLSDLILYLLDTALNLTSFLFVYQPGCSIFHSLHFETRIVSVYENTIPIMCQQLALLAKKDDTLDVYFDLKYKLDLARVQLLKLFRYCASTPLYAILNSKSKINEEMKIHVDDYISVLSEFLADKVFIQDYHKAYPVDQDLEVLQQVCTEFDSDKFGFLMESVLSCYDLPPPMSKASQFASLNGTNSQDYGGPSHSVNGEGSAGIRKLKGVELESLITEVKDILPHLGDGFVQKCLEYFNYESASVINAVLENTLPEALTSLDPEMPAIIEPAEEKIGNLPERLNVFDNDEFDIMTQDTIDTSRVHKGKRKSEHKNINDMLNDKSHVSSLKDTYSKLGIVDVEEELYEDEYDDTYDGLDVSVKEADEPERRPFVTPRVLQTQSHREASEEEESEREVDEEELRRQQDRFVENPEVVRARLEQRRRDQYRGRGGRGGGHQPPPRDVVGKAKGQGQDKHVTANREHKNTNKAFRGNHNRRAMAQRKRNQGMVPS